MIYETLTKPITELKALIDGAVERKQKALAETEKSYIGAKKEEANGVILNSYEETTARIRALTNDYIHTTIANWKMFFVVKAFDYDPGRVESVREMLKFTDLTPVEESVIERKVRGMYWECRIVMDKKRASEAPEDATSAEFARYERTKKPVFRIDSYVSELDTLQTYIDGIVANYNGPASTLITDPAQLNAAIAIERFADTVMETENRINGICPLFFHTSDFDSTFVTDEEETWLSDYERVLRSGFFEKVMNTREDAESILLRSKYRADYLNWYKRIRIDELTKARVAGEEVPEWYFHDGLFFYNLTPEDFHSMEVRGVNHSF